MQIEKYFIILVMVIVILIVIFLSKDIIGEKYGNALAIAIAIIEIFLAIAVWTKYTSDQKSRKKYQSTQLLTTLCSIHAIIFRLYNYQFINKNKVEYELKKRRLIEQITILENQTRVADDLLNKQQLEEIITGTNELPPFFLHRHNKIKNEFLVYAYPFAVLVSKIIEGLGGKVYDDNAILKPTTDLNDVNNNVS